MRARTALAGNARTCHALASKRPQNCCPFARSIAAVCTRWEPYTCRNCADTSGYGRPPVSPGHFASVSNMETESQKIQHWTAEQPNFEDETTLDDIRVIPLPHRLAKRMVERQHYLHSMPGGTELCFGVVACGRLSGVVTLGAGPFNAYRLVEGAEPPDCLVLTRLWLGDELPRNSESRMIGQILRILKRSTDVKFIVTYADPAHGHVGTIYQATNWVYTGLSEATSMLETGDGVIHHSRSLAYNFGTHNTGFLTARGLDIKKVSTHPKHRYIYFLDRSYRDRLLKPVFPYPKHEEEPCASA